MQQAGIRHTDEDGANQEYDHRGRQAAQLDLLVHAVGFHEVDQAHTTKRPHVEEQHHGKHEGKAFKGKPGCIGAEAEGKRGDRVMEEGRRHKHKQLRKQHAQHQTAREGTDAADERLERQHGRHLRAAHAEHLIETKFALAPANEEVVGIHHEETQHQRKENREPAHDAADGRDNARGIATQKIRLVSNGVERIEDSHAQGDRNKVDGKVAQGLADVAKGKLSDHRSRLPR